MAAEAALSGDAVGFAPAKVNLTLHVLGRRPDGYHEIESLVAFADIGDRLALLDGEKLALETVGPTAAAAGADGDNLVLKAARALMERTPGLRLRGFRLDKHLPVAAGLGGGSSDAAAALRLLARENHLPLDDARIFAAARATGADVPVCLDPRPRMMRGIGDVLATPLALPRLAAVLVNPGVAVPTKDVFAALAAPALSVPASADEFIAGGANFERVVSALANRRNDLERPAITLAPVIADVLFALRAVPECRLARMSGSGATCFGLFASAHDAQAAARGLQATHAGWWVRATAFG
jgi:4-diphosphocytidyl-2-C-methyl-D-erythritol kinase